MIINNHELTLNWYKLCKLFIQQQTGSEQQREKKKTINAVVSFLSREAHLIYRPETTVKKVQQLHETSLIYVAVNAFTAVLCPLKRADEIENSKRKKLARILIKLNESELLID